MESKNTKDEKMAYLRSATSRFIAPDSESLVSSVGLNSVFWGTIFAFLGVAFGAFGAHFIHDKIQPKNYEVFQIAVIYQMYHAFALVLYGLYQNVVCRSYGLPMKAFCGGIVLFSGSLYILALTNIRQIGMVTPLGGLAFLVGWSAFAFDVWRYQRMCNLSHPK